MGHLAIARQPWYVRKPMQRLADYLRKMRSVLYRRGRRRDEIEDLMQDAFVRLLEYCERGAEVREPEAVLVRIARENRRFADWMP